MKKSSFYLPIGIDREMRIRAAELGLRYPTEFIMMLWDNFKGREINKMKIKSHTLTELKKAKNDGQQIFALDTGNDGEDDTLIGNRKKVMKNILDFHELEEFPEHWTLTEVDYDF